MGLFPPEREIPLDDRREWALWARFHKARFRSRSNRRKLVKAVIAERGKLDNCSDNEFQTKAKDAGKLLLSAPMSVRNLVEIMVLVDEALFRCRGFRFHNSQLEAGLLLATGHFAEMATGEGKTLTATLPLAIHGLAGCGCHVVTVNDYLAERDAEEVRPLLNMLGLTIGCVTHDMEQDDKRISYGADITYCANKELVFDYLRERARSQRASPLAYRLQLAGFGQIFENARPLIENLDFVLIDEADSVLIDEANIPLILTEPVDDALSKSFVQQAIDMVEEAQDDVWEAADALGYRNLRPEALVTLVEGIQDPAPEWQSLAIAEEMLSKTRMAQDRFTRDVHYIVEEDTIVLVDPQTGRPTPDRTLPWGVQQVIEHREGLEISPNRKVIAKQSFQNFFRRYHKLAGMSGTVREVRKELAKTYATPVARVPTNRPVIRERHQRLLFLTTEQKIEWAIARADTIAASGRAVLIGVSSVSLSEQVSAALTEQGRHHDVLNARRPDEEADIVSHAGEAGRITVVTNMAGRGTDIKLSPSVKAQGGLHVIILDTLDTSRLERQLYGRAGRQGDPGSYDIAHALDEPELLRIIGKRVPKLLQNLVRVAPSFTIRAHYLYVEWRRNQLERHRRNRRLKLLKSEEKRNELLAFTRAD